MSKNSLPDKCKHCGLRVKYDFTSANESMSSDAAFSELRKLSDAGYVPKFRRRVSASNIDFGSTEICAISSKSWLEPTKKCKHWVLRIQGATIADYLSIHHDRRNYKSAIWSACIGSMVTVLLFLIGLAAGGK